MLEDKGDSEDHLSFQTLKNAQESNSDSGQTAQIPPKSFAYIATRKTQNQIKAGPESTNQLVFAFDRRHAKRDHQNRAGKATCLCQNPSNKSDLNQSIELN